MNQNEVKEFGARICALRKARGMTQAQLAEMIHVSNKAVSRWETGEGYPEITLLRPLARALGVSVDELLSEDDESEQDDPDSPFQKQDGKQTYYGGIGGKKEYKHRDIPVAWPNFSFNVKNLKKKSLGLLDMAAYIYFIIFVCVLYSANLALRYLSSKSWHMGQFCTSQMGYIFLGIAAVVGIALIVLHAYLMARDSRRFPYVRNMVFLGAALLSPFICLNPVQGIINENKETTLMNCEPGTWLGCDFFQVDRKLILIITVVLILFYIGSTLINTIFMRKKGGSETKPAPEPRAFWRSLIVFNKISWVCLIITFVCVVIYLIMCILISISYSFGNLYYFITGSSAIVSVVITVISSVASKVGIIAGLIGIGAGLLDACDRQIKASVIFVIANLVLMYVPTLLIIASQGMAFMSFFDSGSMLIDPFIDY